MIPSWSRKSLSSFTIAALLVASFAFVLPQSAYAAIAQRGTATSGTSTNGSITIAKPTGVVAGDVMIANIAQSDDNDTVSNNANLSGWTLIAGADLAGITERYGTVLYKVAGASEPANYTFDLDNDATGNAGAIIAFSGVDTTGGVTASGAAGGPFDVDPGNLNVTNASTATTSSITTVSANAAVIMLAQVAGSNSNYSSWTTTSPGGLTELYDAGTNSNERASVGAAWAIKATAGTTGTGSVNLSPNERSGAILVALKMLATDVTAPTLAQVTPVPTPTNDNTPNYTFSSNEAGTITYGGDCSSVTTAAVAGNNTITFNTLADSAHSNCTITVTDAALNASAPLAVSAFTVDTLPPTLAEVAPVTTPTNDNTPNYTFSSTEAGAISYGGSCVSATTAAVVGNNPVTFNTLADGMYGTCTIQVTDSAGNASSLLNVSTFTVDTVLPTVALSLLSSNPTNTLPVLIQALFSEIVTGFDFSDVVFGGVGAASGSVSGSGTTYTISFTPNSDGQVLLDVPASSANDAAGNGNSTSNQASIVYDATAPSVSITSGPANASFINTATPSFSFTATDALSNPVATECQVDGGGYAACTSPFTTATLGEGPHSVDIRGTDGATNISTVASRSFTVDTVQPTVVLTTSVTSPVTTNAWPIVVTATFNENVTGVDASDLTVTPGASLVTASGSGMVYTFNVYPSADGNTEISMNAGAGQDVALNGSNGSTSIFVTPDYTAPVVTPNTASPLVVTLNGTYTESGATAFDAIDGSVPAFVWFGSVDTTTLGTYFIWYYATDAAGNTGFASLTVEVKSVCADGYDNDGDGLIDSGDPACHLDNDNANPASYFAATPSESNATGPGGTNNTPTGTGLGGANPSFLGQPGGQVLGVSVTALPNGEVLGASTSTSGSNNQGSVLGATSGSYSCTDGAYLTDFMKRGQENNPEQVKKLQTFLNDQVQAGLTVSGIFDVETENAVKAFQASNPVQILEPWGISDPTGYVFKTTLRWINSMACGVTAPMPTL